MNQRDVKDLTRALKPIYFELQWTEGEIPIGLKPLIWTWEVNKWVAWEETGRSE